MKYLKVHMLARSTSVPVALLSFTFFKVTGMVGDVTRQGMTSSCPSFMSMISGISLCISTKGLPVSEWGENEKIHTREWLDRGHQALHLQRQRGHRTTLTPLRRLLCSRDLGEGLFRPLWGKAIKM